VVWFFSIFLAAGHVPLQFRVVMSVCNVAIAWARATCYLSARWLRSTVVYCFSTLKAWLALPVPV